MSDLGRTSQPIRPFPATLPRPSCPWQSALVGPCQPFLVLPVTPRGSAQKCLWEASSDSASWAVICMGRSSDELHLTQPKVPSSSSSMSVTGAIAVAKAGVTGPSTEQWNPWASGLCWAVSLGSPLLRRDAPHGVLTETTTQCGPDTGWRQSLPVLWACFICVCIYVYMRVCVCVCVHA